MIYLLTGIGLTSLEYKIQIIADVLDYMCPLKDIKIKQTKEPWMSNEIIELIYDKNNLLKKAKKTHIRTGLQQD